MESVNWCLPRHKGLALFERTNKLKIKRSFLRPQSLHTQFLFKHKGFKLLLTMKLPYFREEHSSGKTLLSCSAANPTPKLAILLILLTWSRNTQLSNNPFLMNKIIRKLMTVSEIVYRFSWSKKRAITSLMWAAMITDRCLLLKSSQSNTPRLPWGERLICQK